MPARPCSTAFRSSGRPSRQVHPALDVALGQPVDPPDRPLLQDGPLLDLDDQDQTPADVALLHHDVVELSGAEQRSDGALDIAVVDRLVDDDAGGADDLGGAEPLVPFHRDAVDRGRRGLLRPKRRRRSHKENAGGKDQKETAHR